MPTVTTPRYFYLRFHLPTWKVCILVGHKSGRAFSPSAVCFGPSLIRQVFPIYLLIVWRIIYIVDRLIEKKEIGFYMESVL